MKLLLDEMYPPVIAEQLRARGHDVVSIHDPKYQRLEGATDDEVFMAAKTDGRLIVTENVPDFRRLQAEAIARGESPTGLIFTTDRQFPRGRPRTTGQLIRALAALLAEPPAVATAMFLKARPPARTT